MTSTVIIAHLATSTEQSKSSALRCATIAKNHSFVDSVVEMVS